MVLQSPVIEGVPGFGEELAGSVEPWLEISGFVGRGFKRILEDLNSLL